MLRLARVSLRDETHEAGRCTQSSSLGRTASSTKRARDFAELPTGARAAVLSSLDGVASIGAATAGSAGCGAARFAVRVALGACGRSSRLGAGAASRFAEGMAVTGGGA